MDKKIRLGISACLLGEKVRFDGGHKLDRYLMDTLGRFVDYVPVCPEAEAGFGIPREPMHLAGSPASPSLVTIHTGIDQTERMLAWSSKKLDELEREDLCGFIFKSRSPSSGMERVKVYTGKGVSPTGSGIFARAFMDRFPLTPVEDEGRIQDPKLRENFIERVFVFKRWNDFLKDRPDMGKLVGFHAGHKLLLLSHSTEFYRRMGRLVGEGEKTAFDALLREYGRLLMDAMCLKATPSKNTNVLMHILGYFKKELTSDEKRELLENIRHYHDGNLPLIVPVTLLNHYVRKYNQEYLKSQYYLNPHPLELQLRNNT
jgi:uncharacterized protein YbgA (DUF1722 family)/uncharacterized protein YbbK (DUF523 family)